MKATLLFLMILAVVPANANNVFRKNSILPPELQARVIAYVGERCGHGDVKIQNLKENSTTVVIDEVDFGVRDRYYATELHATWWFDGSHPSTYRINVRSGEWAISNPSVDRFEILGLSADQGVCN